jgi:hypothetical protein
MKRLRFLIPRPVNEPNHLSLPLKNRKWIFHLETSVMIQRFTVKRVRGKLWWTDGDVWRNWKIDRTVFVCLPVCLPTTNKYSCGITVMDRCYCWSGLFLFGNIFSNYNNTNSEFITKFFLQYAKHTEKSKKNHNVIVNPN